MPRFVGLNLCDVWFARVKRNKLQPKDVNGKGVKFCVKANITGNKAHEVCFLHVYVTLGKFHENYFNL
jgi:predicted thioesterase